MLPVSCWSWQLQLSELPAVRKTLCFLLNIRIDNCSFQSYLKPRRRYVLRQLSGTLAFRATKFCQLSELTFLLTAASKVTKILSTVWVDVSVDRSFQSYQNCVNCVSCVSKLCQLGFPWLLELTSLTFRANKIMSEFLKELTELASSSATGDENPSFQSYLKLGRRHASRQLLQLTKVGFKAFTKIKIKIIISFFGS